MALHRTGWDTTICCNTSKQKLKYKNIFRATSCCLALLLVPNYLALALTLALALAFSTTADV